MKIDLKSFVAGVILVVMVVFGMGAVGTANKADFGFAVPETGYAVVADEGGNLFIINRAAMAKKVLLVRVGR